MFIVEATRTKQDLEITWEILLTFKACRSQILSDVNFNTVSIIAGGKDSKLNVCSHHKMRTTSPGPSG